MAHSPAFQLYYKDFRQDPKTICMDGSEIGAYFLLILECWDRDNTLPDDVTELALIARTPEKKFVRIWDTKIKRCFQYDGRRRVFWHKRLAAEIQKQKEWSATNSVNGKKGAEKRWAKHRKNGGADSVAMAGLCGAIAPDGSSSSSSFKPANAGSATREAVFLGTVLEGIRSTLNIRKLTKAQEKDFEENSPTAFDNGFTASEFVECFTLLRQQEWRHSLPKAGHVVEALPNLKKLRAEIKTQNRQRNDEDLPSIQQKLADDAANRAVLRTPPKTTEIEGIQ